MGNLKLAVISDLHIGDKARSKDLSPYEVPKLLDENYVEGFIGYIKKNEIRPDYLVVPGDVTGRATEKEFELASNIILRISDAFEIPESKILFVPGNHDKDWDISSTGNLIADNVLAYKNLNNPENLFKRLNDGSSFIDQSERWAVWDEKDVLAIGYNSAWHDGMAEKTHHGLIDEVDLAAISDKLKEYDVTSDRLKLFLIHHHPILYSNHIPDIPDFSAMTNAQNLLKMLSEFRFDILIHGHRHMPHFHTPTQNNGHPIVILGAGSFCYGLDNTYHNHAGNLFHLVHIDGRDQESETVFGVVQSWTYLAGHGWKPSEMSSGIFHCVGFGTYTNPVVLKKHLKPFVDIEIKKNNYFQWSSFVKEDEKLGYLQPECILQAFKELASEMNLQIFGKESPEKLMLLGPRE